MYWVKFFIAAAFTFAKFEQKGQKMSEEWVPHQQEGHSGPQDMATFVMVEGGEGVGNDVRKGQN